MVFTFFPPRPLSTSYAFINERLVGKSGIFPYSCALFVPYPSMVWPTSSSVRPYLWVFTQDFHAGPILGSWPSVNPYYCVNTRSWALPHILATWAIFVCWPCIPTLTRPIFLASTRHLSLSSCTLTLLHSLVLFHTIVLFHTCVLVCSFPSHVRPTYQTNILC